MKVITIGRSSDNNIVIQDPLVGRHHLQIIKHNDGHFSAVDINSKNGTFINGKRIYGEVRLNLNDVIQIGQTSLPWMSYFSLSGNSSRKRNISRMLPIILCICGVLVAIIFLYSGKSRDYTPSDITQHTERPVSMTKSGIFKSRRNISEDLVGQTISAPSEDGYFPKDWRWTLEPGEVLNVQELNRRKDSSGYDEITIFANLHRGEVKIDVEMILKYSPSGLISSRVTSLTIPRQTDYSQYVELEMDYDFVPALMLYNRSNITLFVGGDYGSGNDRRLFSSIVEPHSSAMVAIGNAEYYHVHFAYEK